MTFVCRNALSLLKNISFPIGLPYLNNFVFFPHFNTENGVNGHVFNTWVLALCFIYVYYTVDIMGLHKYYIIRVYLFLFTKCSI